MATDNPTAPVGLDLADHFGKNLRRCRRRAGLSQEALGREAKLHRTEIGLLERGERIPRIDTLLKLSGGLELGPEQLLTGIAWNAGTTTPGMFLGAEAGERS